MSNKYNNKNYFVKLSEPYFIYVFSQKRKKFSQRQPGNNQHQYITIVTLINTYRLYNHASKYNTCVLKNIYCNLTILSVKLKRCRDVQSAINIVVSNIPFTTTGGTSCSGMHKMSLSFDYRLTSICEPVREWPTVPFLEHPIEIFKDLKLLPLNMSSRNSTDKFIIR